MLHSSPSNPLLRDREARRDLTLPPGSPRLQRWLIGFVALVLTTVTGAELVMETPRLPATAAELALAFETDGLVGLNHRLLAAIEAFDDDRKERSLVATAVAPWIQWVQTTALGVGDHQVRLGRDGWLFLRPAVEFVTGPGFLEPGVLERRRQAADSWRDPIAPDPLPAILAFQRDLASRGIELVFLPVPTKAQIYPDRLAERAQQVLQNGIQNDIQNTIVPLYNPSWNRLLQALADAGVRVIDPAPALAAAAAAQTETETETQFLTRDTHWTPEALETTARQVAEALATVPFAQTPEPGWSRDRATVSHAGDLTELLGLPIRHQPWPQQSVTTRPVSDPAGRPWQPRSEAEVLLLGDSFSNVYSTPDLGWGVGAGLAEQLSWALERPVDRIAINAGGASGARRRLAAELAGGRDRLSGKRVVVWEVSTRELAFGDWEVVSLAPNRGASGTVPPLPTVPTGDGLVVWESNRTGPWRLFARSLAGGAPRQISRDEPGRQHCCPHFSPDGTKVAYLSRTDGADAYPKVEQPGELRLLSTGDWSERTLTAARTYGWGNRAVVWRDDDTLHFVDAQGRSAELTVSTGATRLLVDKPRDELGYLLDPQLGFATSAAPTFSLYQPGSLAVAERSRLGGCEPYFSSDGRWGYWNAGPGGPIQRIDLRTRAVHPLILRDDPRLPPGWRYLYFVMTSKDDRAMAWGASNGDHHHFSADYEIFVAPTDPNTLEIVGEPRRITNHPATDRYPDVHLEPLALGYHRVEAPHRAQFGSPTSPPRQWQVDGQTVGVGPTLEHLFGRSGTHRVIAVGPGDTEEEGLVVVEPSHPPSVIQTRLRDAGRSLRIEFDEPIEAADGKVETDPADLLSGWKLVDHGGALEVDLAHEATTGLRVRTRGFSDLAQRPNPLSSEWIEVASPSWPTIEHELLFAWENGRAANLVFDPELGTDRASSLETSGRAYPDRSHALVLDGGWARARDSDANQIARRLDSTLEISLELLITATTHPATSDATRSLLTLAPRRGHPLLELRQRGNRLEIGLLTSDERPARPIVLASVEPGVTHHLALSFTAARLLVVLDGQPLKLERQPIGTLGPWRGKNPRLQLGAGANGASWHGTIEALAVWGRAFDEEILNATWERAKRRLTTRPLVESRRVEATLVARSPVPTLDEISPYRSGLVTFVWQPISPADARPIPVVHWALLDGNRQPTADLSIGSTATLLLEPLADQPQLEPYFLSDQLRDRTSERWLEVGLTPP